MRKKDYSKPVEQPKAPVINLKLDTKTQETLIETQIESTLALTEAITASLDHTNFKDVIEGVLSKIKSNTNKRLTINRDHNGLIQYIDIEEI